MVAQLQQERNVVGAYNKMGMFTTTQIAEILGVSTLKLLKVFNNPTFFMDVYPICANWRTCIDEPWFLFGEEDVVKYHMNKKGTYLWNLYTAYVASKHKWIKTPEGRALVLLTKRYMDAPKEIYKSMTFDLLLQEIKDLAAILKG